jgi:outer membrane protein
MITHYLKFMERKSSWVQEIGNRKPSARNWFFLLCFFGAMAGSPAFAQQTYTLKQCIDTAVRNNIQVQQTGLQAERDKVLLNQAKMNMLPDLNGTFNYGWNQGRVIDPFTNIFINQQLQSSGLGLNSNVALFNGFQMQNTVKQNALAFEASKMEWQQSKDNLTLNVLIAYLQVLANEDLVEINRNQLSVTRSQAERLEVMVKEGAIGQFQLSDIRGQLSNEQINLINSGNALQSAKLNLCQLMNIPYQKDMQLDRSQVETPASLYGLTAEEIYEESLEKFAQVKAAELRVRSAEKNVKVQQGGFYPRIGFGASLNTNYSSAANTQIPGAFSEVATGDYVRFNNTQVDVLTQQQSFTTQKISYGKQLDNNLGRYFGFNAQIPLFNNLRNVNNVKLARLNLKNATLENDRTLQILRQNIEQAHLNMTATYERYKALAEQVNEFETSFRASEIRFNNGVINSVEYLQTKNNLDRARVNLTQSKYEYIFRMRILDFYRGIAVG